MPFGLLRYGLRRRYPVRGDIPLTPPLQPSYDVPKSSAVAAMGSRLHTTSQSTTVSPRSPYLRGATSLAGTRRGTRPQFAPITSRRNPYALQGSGIPLRRALA